MPSTRALATALGVARKSVLQAYALLCAEELTIARGGSGTRVAKVASATHGEPLVDPGLFHSWRRKLAAAVLRAGPTYPAAGGYLPLRRAIADYLARRRGVLCSAADILIVAGTQQALTLVERVLVDPGERVVVEDPHYQPAVHGLLAHGAQVRSAKSMGLGVYPIHPYYRNRPARLLIGYAGLSVGQLKTAVDLFARCLETNPPR